jgi:polyisoprenyl-phosphate glycosyltransferase
MGEHRRAACENPAHVKLSVVIPARDEESALPELFSRLARALGELAPEWEVVIVDDGSGDGTWAAIEAASHEEPRIRGLRLSRNFGHQVALTAGLSATSGDYVVTMDADLQHPPETIAALVRKAQEGFDVVYAVRSATDAEGRMKVSSARWFYRALNRLTSLDLPMSGGDFRLMSRRVVDVLLVMPERHRFLRGMTRWVGFEQATVEFDRDARHGGRTKYSQRAMVRLALDAIVGFSAVPLRVASMLGLFLSFLGALYFLYVIAVRLFTDSAVGGWASLLGVVLLLGGVQLACIGIIGQYLGRMYDELKNRPLFVLRADTHLGAPLPRDPHRPEPEPAVPLSAGGAVVGDAPGGLR